MLNLHSLSRSLHKIFPHLYKREMLFDALRMVVQINFLRKEYVRETTFSLKISLSLSFNFSSLSYQTEADKNSIIEVISYNGMTYPLVTCISNPASYVMVREGEGRNNLAFILSLLSLHRDAYEEGEASLGVALALTQGVYTSRDENDTAVERKGRKVKLMLVNKLLERAKVNHDQC
jgi:hypothetical protein